VRRITLILVLALVAAACGGGVEASNDAPATSLGTLPATTTEPTTTTPTSTTTTSSSTTTIGSTTTVPANTTTTTAASATTTTAPPTSTTATTAPEPLEDLRLAADLVFSGLRSPVFLTAPRGDDRLFVLEQAGRILVSRNGETAVFLDIQDRVIRGGERGLLGLAFHPSYVENRRFFVNYTNIRGNTVVAEFTTDPVDPNLVDPDTERVLLTVNQPAANHNGGMIAFGPDGSLYIGLGDGGGANDQYGQGQRTDTLLGTILRIDVDGGDPYGIPATNPFADGDGGAPEVWAWGLRNPWRFSFDGEDIYIADVGQSRWEEVDVIPSRVFGVNFGWPITEAFECLRAETCDTTGLVEPVYAYAHEEGRCSITGGYVYRGTAIPALQGAYLFGDFCSGEVIGFRINGEGVYDIKNWTGDIGTRLITSFGRDGFGELYTLSQGGDVFKIVPGR
jgi:glucose/arabinose dehydrogenase